MHCLVTGGTGFIGAALCAQLARQGWQITVLTRHPESAQVSLPTGTRCTADLQSLETACDAVVNLAGEPIADKRWSAARKRLIEDSRIGLTRELVAWMKTATRAPAVLISGSAVGWYGDGGERELDENSPPHDEYTHRLCRDWEAAALEAASTGTRVCLLRTGLVVGRGGGFLKKMLPPFKLGLGGPLGNGQQYMPWIHRDDLLAMIEWLLAEESLSGVFNGSAPNPVTNREFSRTLGRVLGRPVFLPVPAAALRLGLGDMSRLLLTGQRAVPKRALDHGFDFKFPLLEGALRDVL